MKLSIFSGIFFIILCLFFSCTRQETSSRASWFQDNGKIKVLCTTAMVADLVQHIGGEKIDMLVLIHGDHDPHSYQLVKGDDEKFDRADIIFYNGLGLEHGPSLSKRLHSSSRAFSLGGYIHSHFPDLLLGTDNRQEQNIGVDMGFDPHIWMDISIFMKALPGICEQLVQLSPENKQLFQENTETYTATLHAAHNAVLHKLQQVPEKNRYLVTTHDAFRYFARAYLATDAERSSQTFWLRCQAPEGLAPDSQLTTHDISRLLAHLMKYKIHCIFAESNISQDSIRKLQDASRRKGFEVYIPKEPLYGDAMGALGSGADSYRNMMKYNAEIIVREFLKSEGL